MLSVNLGHGKGRIWQGDLPPWTYHVIDVVQAAQPALPLRAPNARQAAIELYTPIGGMALYGALGATFTQTDTKILTIQVCGSTDGEHRLTDALCGKVDSAYIGLPREYLDGILSAAMNMDSTRSLGSGVLRFCRGAYGRIGSSTWFFQRITHIVISLLLEAEQHSQESDVIELIRKELHSPSR